MLGWTTMLINEIVVTLCIGLGFGRILKDFLAIEKY